MAKKPLDDATKKRLRAGRMLLAGKRPAEVALAVGVARQTVYTWKGLLDEGGIDALRAVPGRGRPAKLDEEQLAQLRQCYCKVQLNIVLAPSYGHSSASACSSSIKRMFGVEVSQTQVWRILGALGFSAQKPERRAMERDEEAVRHWKRHTWPALKKKPSAKAD